MPVASLLSPGWSWLAQGSYVEPRVAVVCPWGLWSAQDGCGEYIMTLVIHGWTYPCCPWRVRCCRGVPREAVINRVIFLMPIVEVVDPEWLWIVKSGYREPRLFQRWMWRSHDNVAHSKVVVLIKCIFHIVMVSTRSPFWA